MAVGQSLNVVGARVAAIRCGAPRQLRSRRGLHRVCGYLAPRIGLGLGLGSAKDVVAVVSTVCTGASRLA
eukprot:scaffold95134_cov46-Phaeocystis_antarctica.AAC.2